jgi:superfamily I DNA/RNA helicase
VGGTRPDLVLVHPRAGVQVIEVKDYDLGAYDLSGTSWQVKSDGQRYTTGNPFAQVDAARNALFQILFPFAGEAKADNRSLFGFTRAGVFLTRASSSQLETARAFAKRTLGRAHRHYGLASRSTLQEDLEALIPLLRHEETGSSHVRAIEKRAEAIGLEKPWTHVLHDWLHPTPDEAAQNAPLELTGPQRRAAWNTARRLLITGPAGSGKTLVLARRAAHALIRDRDVLLLGFNITLWHYIRDFVARAVRTALVGGHAYTSSERREMGTQEFRRRVRAELRPRYRRAMRRLTITHYHRLAYDLWRTLGHEADAVTPRTVASALVRDRAAIQRLVDQPESGVRATDVLLLDEGQDGGPEWLDSLQPLLRPDATLTVAADPAQRIYDHAVSDPRDLFADVPNTVHLEGTARVPTAILPAVNAASERWLDAETVPPLDRAEQLSIDFDDRPSPKATWTTAQDTSLLPTLVAAVRRRVMDGLNPSQIAVLVPTHKVGRAVETLLEQTGLPVCSVCVDQPDVDRSRKHAFWRLDPRLKLSTVHSFKGWEADAVVVLLPQLPPREEDRETLHVAVTRTRGIIDVIAPPGGETLSGWQHRRGLSLRLAFPPAMKATAPPTVAPASEAAE